MNKNEEFVESGEPFRVDREAMRAKLGVNRAKLWRHRASLLWAEFWWATLLLAASVGAVAGWNIDICTAQVTCGRIKSAAQGATIAFGVSVIAFMVADMAREVWKDFILPKVERLRNAWTPDRLTDRLRDR